MSMQVVTGQLLCWKEHRNTYRGLISLDPTMEHRPVQGSVGEKKITKTQGDQQEREKPSFGGEGHQVKPHL